MFTYKKQVNASKAFRFLDPTLAAIATLCSDCW